MQHQYTIRPIRIEEASKAKRLIYTVAHPLMEPQRTLQELMDRWEGWGVFTDLDDIQKNYFDQNGVFLVVEVDGHIVGTGAFKQYMEGAIFLPGGRLRLLSNEESLITGEGLCEIRRITLLPEWRGKKIGYALMLELIRRARELGYSEMMLWTDPIKLHHAVDFYHQMGFTDIEIEGVDPDEVWMRINI